MSDIVERLRDTADAFELAHAPHHLVLHMRAGADEIERLRAGGCARNQRTTQYCAEAAILADKVGKLEAEAHSLTEDNERLRDELNARCPVDAMDRGMSPVEAAVWHVWGDRCSDFEPECFTCKAWAEFDRTERLRAALEPFACDCEGKAICIGECMHRNARAVLEGKHE